MLPFFLGEVPLGGSSVSYGSGPTYTLTCDTGAFTVTGNSSSLLYGRKLTATVGVFSETGNPASLLYGRKLDAFTGVFSETGNPASLLYGRSLPVTVGAFNLTGNDASLTYTPVGGATYTLPCSSGVFLLTGNTTSLDYTSTAPVVPTAGGDITTWMVNDYGGRKITGFVIDEEVKDHQRDPVAHVMPVSCGVVRIVGSDAFFVRGVTLEQDEADLLELIELALMEE